MRSGSGKRDGKEKKTEKRKQEKGKGKKVFEK
jgi:hypothetical protein